MSSYHLSIRGVELGGSEKKVEAVLTIANVLPTHFPVAPVIISSEEDVSD